MSENARQAETSRCKTTDPPTASSPPSAPRVAERAAPGRTLRRATLGAGVASAFAASICCIGPLAAALLGFTSLSAAVGLHVLRPYLMAVTLLFLAIAFYLTYRKGPAAVCEPGSLCEAAGQGRMARMNRVVLWIAAAVSLLVLTFPTWSGWIWR